MTEPDDLPPFAKAYRGMVRESGGQDPYSETEAVNFLKNAFMDITNGATELPDAMGFFVDNSGSTAFTQVNQALISFKQWVETNYGTAVGGNVATATRTDPKFIDPEGEDAAAGLGKTGWVQGIYLAGYENWIEQSQNAIKDMIANDPDIAAATEKGSLSDSNSGVKSMLDPVYALDDFDLEELNNFMNTLSTARAQNGAEQSRIKHELDELQTKQVGLEQAMERADGLDYSLAMARYSKSRDQLHFTANLVSAAREMENILYTDFLDE
jgi:flagellin-like hook-associated protein FlgL